MVAAFVASERAFSPFFQSCISENQNTDKNSVTKEQPSRFGFAVIQYVRCSGRFVEGHGVGITALASIAIAAFTGTLWFATRTQARWTKEALFVDKRAFVFASSIYPSWELDQISGSYNWRFRPIWQNSGETATKGMTLYVDCEIRNTPLPVGFDFKRTIMPPGTGMLGPKSSNMGGAAPHFGITSAITPQDLSDVQNSRKFLYLWGWAKYFDRFPGTPEHITRFCWQIVLTGDPFGFVPNQNPTLAGSLNFSYIIHSEGNCADDECASWSDAN